MQSAADLYTNQKNNCKSITNHEFKLRKRLIKASKGLSLLKGFDKYIEYIFCEEYFFDANFNDDLDSAVNSWLNDLDLSKNQFYGQSIRIIKRDEKILIVISIILI